MRIYIVISIFSFLCLGGLTSCNPPPVDPALKAYENFMGALRFGATEKVWAALSTSTQSRLMQKMSSQVHSDLSPQTTTAIDPTSPDQKSKVHSIIDLQLDWSFESPFGQKGRLVSLPESTPNRKWIQVIYRHQALLIPIVLEEQEWKIDLLSTRPSSSS